MILLNIRVTYSFKSDNSEIVTMHMEWMARGKCIAFVNYNKFYDFSEVYFNSMNATAVCYVTF